MKRIIRLTLNLIAMLFFMEQKVLAQPANSPWPLIGHDMNNTCLSNSKGPEKVELKWQSNVNYYLKNIIVGSNNSLYVNTGRIWSNTSDRLRALDQNGKMQWEFNNSNKYLSRSPAIDRNGNIYIASTDYLFALNENGTTNWKLPIGPSTYIPSAPIIGSDGTIYFSLYDTLYSIRSDASFNWKLKFKKSLISYPAIGSDGTIYTVSDDSCLYAIDKNGIVKWKYRASSYCCDYPAIGPDGTIYFTSYVATYGTTNIYAIDPNGNRKWGRYWTITNWGSLLGNLAIAPDGTIYATFGSVLWAFSASAESTYKWSFDTEGTCSRPMIDQNGTIYIVASDVQGSHGDDTRLYALNSNGELKWSYIINDFISNGNAPPVLDANGSIYFGDEQGLYSLGSSKPPSSINDLSILNFSSTSIVLGWTSPGDDYSVGTATKYNIRYSKSEINNSNWNNATLVSSPPQPLVSGSFQSYRMGNLQPNTTYFIAIKSADEADNWSELSNVISITTRDTTRLGDWEIQTVDSGISFNLTSLVINNNIPCIAYYGGANLYYSRFLNNTWMKELIAVENSVSKLSLAVSSQNSPSILYYTGKDLKYALFNGLSWKIETILSDNGADISSLCVDGSGNPAFCYYDIAYQNLKYASFNGTSWNFQTIFSNASNPSLCFDNNGKPHISYYSSGSIKYAYYDGSSWQSTVIESGKVLSNSKIAVDKNGLPHIVYSTYYETCTWSDMGICIVKGPNVNQLKYAYFNGSSWSISNIESTTGSNVNIFFDQSNNPYLVYYKGAIVCTNNVPFLGCMGQAVSMKTTQYAIKQGSSWSKGTLFSTYCPYFFLMDINGNLHYSSIVNGTVKYSVRNGSSWQTVQTVDAQKKLGNYNSIFLDIQGNPHISYYDEFYGDLKLSYYNGTTWDTEKVDTLGNTGTYTSIVLNQSGQTHIGYRDEGKGNLKYAFVNGMSRVIETVDTLGNIGQYISIALNKFEQPIISYYDASQKDLKCAQFNGSSWQSATVDSSGDVGSFSSMVIDNINNYCIAYYDKSNHRLKYTEFTGSVWITSIVDSGFTSLNGISMTLDQAGNSVICYAVDNLVKHARHIGSTWQIQIVDNQTSSGVSIRYSDGRPCMAYNTSSGLKLAILNESKWSIYELGLTSTSFMLALDKSGHPHISYYDSQKGSLKYIVNPVLTEVESQFGHDGKLPDAFILYQNYPNPFNPTTVIRFELPVSNNVTVNIYNILGQRVKTLVDDYIYSGSHIINWDGKNDFGVTVSSGIYFCRMEAGKFIKTIKLMMLR